VRALPRRPASKVGSSSGENRSAWIIAGARVDPGQDLGAGGAVGDLVVHLAAPALVIAVLHRKPV